MKLCFVLQRVQSLRVNWERLIVPGTRTILLYSGRETVDLPSSAAVRAAALRAVDPGLPFRPPSLIRRHAVPSRFPTGPASSLDFRPTPGLGRGY